MLLYLSINALRVQTYAFKLIARGLFVPEHLQHTFLLQNGAIQDLEKFLQGPDIPARIVDTAVKINKVPSKQPDVATSSVSISETPADKARWKSGEQESDMDLLAGSFMADDVNSVIYPYNAYTYPFTHPKHPENLTPA